MTGKGIGFGGRKGWDHQMPRRVSGDPPASSKATRGRRTTPDQSLASETAGRVRGKTGTPSWTRSAAQATREEHGHGPTPALPTDGCEIASPSPHLWLVRDDDASGDLVLHPERRHQRRVATVQGIRLSCNCRRELCFAAEYPALGSGVARHRWGFPLIPTNGAGSTRGAPHAFAVVVVWRAGAPRDLTPGANTQRDLAHYVSHWLPRQGSKCRWIRLLGEVPRSKANGGDFTRLHAWMNPASQRLPGGAPDARGLGLERCAGSHLDLLDRRRHGEDL